MNPRNPPVFKASLIKTTLHEGVHPLVLLSNEATLDLSLVVSTYPFFSVVDSNGWIVRSAQNWLSYLRRQIGLTYSVGTVEQYGRTLSYLCRWIEADPPYPNLSIEENIKLLSRHDVINWLDYMKSQGAEGKKTLHGREVCLKEFLTWLSTDEGGRIKDLENSPWGRDNTLRYVVGTPNARSPKYISSEMIVELLLGMYNECERCMFHAQYDMGLRISELVDLKAGDIPDEKHYDPAFEFIPICINGVKGRGGQKKERITLISRAVLKRIKRYHSSQEYKLAPDWDIGDPKKPAFLTSNQRKWSVRNASKQFKNSVRRVGLPDGMRTHWMRHGTAYSVLRSDIGKTYQDRMLMLQQMFGHARLATTEIYTQISPALLEKLTQAGKLINRLGEAEYIRENSFLASLQHKEKRGHRE